jgi:hypothetical protein
MSGAVIFLQNAAARRDEPMARAAVAQAAKRRKTTRAKVPRAKATRRKASGQKTARGKTKRYWSARVTKESDALDLEGGVFSLQDPKRIAASLKRSAQQSRRRKTEPYRSALSMLVFYINRAGKNLSAARRRKLEQAKVELRRQFGRQ